MTFVKKFEQNFLIRFHLCFYFCMFFLAHIPPSFLITWNPIQGILWLFQSILPLIFIFINQLIFFCATSGLCCAKMTIFEGWSPMCAYFFNRLWSFFSTCIGGIFWNYWNCFYFWYLRRNKECFVLLPNNCPGCFA